MSLTICLTFPCLHSNTKCSTLKTRSSYSSCYISSDNAFCFSYMLKRAMKMMPKLKVSRQGHGPWFKSHVVFHWIMSGFSEASVDLLCPCLYTFPLGDIYYGLLNFTKCRVFSIQINYTCESGFPSRNFGGCICWLF